MRNEQLQAYICTYTYVSEIHDMGLILNTSYSVLIAAAQGLVLNHDSTTELYTYDGQNIS